MATVPVRHPHLKKDVGKLREDREVIKGLENGTWKISERHYFVPRREGWEVT